MSERHPDMEIGRRAAKQHVERSDRHGAPQALHVVEREHAGRTVAGERAEQPLDAVLGLAARLRVRRPRAFLPSAGRTEGRESGLLEREREVGRDRPRSVLLVGREPRGRDAPLAQRPAAVGEKCRLAEPARGVQHRQTTIQERTASLHLRTLDVALDPRRVTICGIRRQ